MVYNIVITVKPVPHHSKVALFHSCAYVFNLMFEFYIFQVMVMEL